MCDRATTNNFTDCGTQSLVKLPEVLITCETFLFFSLFLFQTKNTSVWMQNVHFKTESLEWKLKVKRKTRKFKIIFGMCKREWERESDVGVESCVRVKNSLSITMDGSDRFQWTAVQFLTKFGREQMNLRDAVFFGQLTNLTNSQCNDQNRIVVVELQCNDTERFECPYTIEFEYVFDCVARSSIHTYTTIRQCAYWVILYARRCTMMKMCFPWPSKSTRTRNRKRKKKMYEGSSSNDWVDSSCDNNINLKSTQSFRTKTTWTHTHTNLWRMRQIHAATHTETQICSLSGSVSELLPQCYCLYLE